MTISSSDIRCPRWQTSDTTCWDTKPFQQQNRWLLKVELPGWSTEAPLNATTVEELITKSHPAMLTYRTLFESAIARHQLAIASGKLKNTDLKVFDYLAAYFCWPTSILVPLVPVVQSGINELHWNKTKNIALGLLAQHNLPLEFIDIFLDEIMMFSLKVSDMVDLMFYLAQRGDLNQAQHAKAYMYCKAISQRYDLSIAFRDRFSKYLDEETIASIDENLLML